MYCEFKSNLRVSKTQEWTSVPVVLVHYKENENVNDIEEDLIRINMTQGSRKVKFLMEASVEGEGIMRYKE